MAQGKGTKRDGLQDALDVIRRAAAATANDQPETTG